MKPMKINLKELREKFPKQSADEQKQNDNLAAFFRERHLVPVSAPTPASSIELALDRPAAGLSFAAEYWVGLLGTANKAPVRAESQTMHRALLGNSPLVVTSMVIHVYNFHESNEDEITVGVTLQ
jgi:hypothetical protein